MSSDELLNKILHELTTQHGLYATDKVENLEKMDPDTYWMLDNTVLIDEIEEKIKKEYLKNFFIV